MNWTYNTIWTEQLSADKLQNIKCTNTKESLSRHISGSYFILNDFKPKDRCFDNFPAITTAIFLELNLSNVHSFKGISKLGPIKRLELHYCTKLERDKGLSEIKNHIEWLHINHSKKFSAVEDLFSLKKLKVLCLNNCAAIENLQFLKEFPELIDFRFVNTNVIDGDLTPLLEHPSLQNVGFLNKRHYNLKEKEAEEHFSKKSELEKEWVYKGESRTFRYRTFSGVKD
jgi:hypothetical protein